MLFFVKVSTGSVSEIDMVDRKCALDTIACCLELAELCLVLTGVELRLLIPLESALDDVDCHGNEHRDVGRGTVRTIVYSIRDAVELNTVALRSAQVGHRISLENMSVRSSKEEKTKLWP